ncbi:MAG: lipoprotein [Ignavibacteria bacterium]|nr:MAG: lipoprotein [Ignavibacteria bacterium]KAF0156890.1 MAG: lipoprotein [Ignavibacteria bacterium]
MIYYKKSIFILILFISITFFLSSCKSGNPVEPQIIPARGQLVGFTNGGSFAAPLIQLMIGSISGGEQIKNKITYDVDYYKLVYRTVDLKGNIITVSGALFLPKGKNNLSLISLQHGTQTKRTNVGSVSALNAPEGLIAASLGYFALVPDYIGLGESTLTHPYHIAKSSADPVIDIIRAGRVFANKNNIALNEQIFLAGYSEGGYVTMAAQREIELNYRSEFPITATAPMAGAYDLNLSAKKILQSQTYNQPAYIAFFMVAYNHVYGWNNLNTFFNSPYAERLPSLFSGNYTTEEINAQLTNDLTKLINQNFTKSYLAGTEVTLTTAFTSNSLLNWKPIAQMRLYHGDSDEYVPYDNSVQAKNYFLTQGVNVELVTIPGGKHVSSALPSIFAAIEWFGTLKLGKNYLAIN